MRAGAVPGAAGHGSACGTARRRKRHNNARESRAVQNMAEGATLKKAIYQVICPW